MKPNTKSNSRNKPYNKKQLMSMSKQERIDIVFGKMKAAIDKSKQDPNKTQLPNFKAYLYDDNNKEFHLEIIKRAFKRRTST